MPENVGASLITEENSPRLTQSYYGDRDIAETEKQIDNLEDGEQAGKSAIKGQLQELRGKIWRETGTEPDKKGILKRSLLEKYLESPVTTQDEWEAMLGHEASIIHESHKKYLPEIFSILSKYKQQI